MNRQVCVVLVPPLLLRCLSALSYLDDSLPDLDGGSDAVERVVDGTDGGTAESGT